MDQQNTTTTPSTPQQPQAVEESKKTNEQTSETPKKKSILRKVVYVLIAIIAFIAIVQVVIADKYTAQVLVIEGERKVGVNPTDQSLDFGDLSSDTSATRIVNMNAGGMDTYVHISKFGEIGELIKVNENNFTMKKGDQKKVEFQMYMPPSAPKGKKYSGSVWIFKIPKVW